jgi:hypothetical protein
LRNKHEPWTGLFHPANTGTDLRPEPADCYSGSSGPYFRSPTAGHAVRAIGSAAELVNRFPDPAALRFLPHCGFLPARPAMPVSCMASRSRSATVRGGARSVLYGSSQDLSRAENIALAVRPESAKPDRRSCLPVSGGQRRHDPLVRPAARHCSFLRVTG